MTPPERNPPPPTSGAEAALVGALVALPHHAAAIFGLVSAEDFGRPDYRAIFVTAQLLHQRGVRCDSDQVIASLTGQGALEHVGGPMAVIDLVAEAGVGWEGWAGEVVRSARLRRLRVAAQQALEDAAKPGAEPGVIAEVLASNAAAAARGAGVVPSGELSTFDEFMARPQTSRSDWVLPGMMRRSWRAMVIAEEGAGKMVLFRQIAIAAAQGIHPLAFTPITPVRTLLVDVENPAETITETAERMKRQALASVGAGEYDADRCHIWHREQGINLRSRADRESFEAVLGAARPDVVLLGPVYKSFRYTSRDREEDAVAELMHTLDDLRTRYGFALLLEHHAPKAVGGKGRALSPFGTSLWLRWCELGITLSTDEMSPNRLKVGRFRKDRSPCSWPARLERSKGWPFVATWPDGQFANRVPNSPDPIAAGDY